MAAYTEGVKKITWIGLSHPGKEVLTFATQPDQYVVHSEVTGGDAELSTVWDMRYSITCDRNWRVRRVFIEDNQTSHRLVLQSNGLGRWTDANGTRISGVDGCIDVDFRATPFSNTLPIRRLDMEVGTSVAIDVVYINAPDLQVSKERQIYTKLSERVWKFEQPSAAFEASITVDHDGFVIDYPGLFALST
jgi:uncharacterized protein